VTRHADCVRARLLVHRAKDRVAAAERRVLARARAWYALTSREVPASRLLNAPGGARVQVERRQAVGRAMGRLILALGLDEETRNNLRAAKRRARRT
jgi:hypothetical protein